MNSLTTLRLQQLRGELEASYVSDSFGLSVLYAIRRELLRLCHGVTLEQLTTWPASLQGSFRQAQEQLNAAPAFPTSSIAVQYQQTERALTALQDVAWYLFPAPGAPAA